jgi:hypothetical protein
VAESKGGKLRRSQFGAACYRDATAARARCPENEPLRFQTPLSRTIPAYGQGTIPCGPGRDPLKSTKSRKATAINHSLSLRTVNEQLLTGRALRRLARLLH